MVQAGEIQVDLGAHTLSADHAKVPACGGKPGPPEQRRLPDAGLAADHKRTTPVGRPFEHAIDSRRLGRATDEVGTLVGDGRRVLRARRRDRYLCS